MTGVWIIYGSIAGVLLAGAALALESVGRLMRRPVRWAWAVTLVLTVVLVGLAPYRSVPIVYGAPGVATVEAAPIGPADLANELSVPVSRPLTAAPSNVLHTRIAMLAATVSQRIPASVDRYFIGFWLFTSASLLALFAAVTVHVHRTRRRWPVTEVHGVRVHLADKGGPAVIGAWQTAIVVPRWLLSQSDAEQRLVLEHEREHVRARDPLLIAAACIVAALLPWHPAVWWMFSRLRLAVELDCDMRVLQRGVAPRIYGGLLIDLAGRCASLPLGAPTLADKSSHLRQRLLAMKPSPQRFPRLRGALLSVAGVAAVLLAATTQVPVISAQTPTSVLRVSEINEPVQAISIPSPRWPQGMSDSASSVDVQYVVDTTGRAEPNSFKVLSRSNPAFVEPALAALRGAVFKPARYQGRPVRQIVQQRITFRRPDTTEAPTPSPAPISTEVVTLDELVATASQQRRRHIGNTITAVRADSVMQTAPIRSLTDLLENRVPGLTVEGSDTMAPQRLRLRGRGSVTPGNPLVILDGVQIKGDSTLSPLDQINPNDIESIEVLKGPSVVTVYGADAANGVIVIKTKRAKGKTPE